jgi:hypothetical protein
MAKLNTGNVVLFRPIRDKEHISQYRNIGNTVSSGVRLPIKLKAQVMAKARMNGDGYKTANTFNGLVKMWAFNYLKGRTQFLRLVK